MLVCPVDLRLHRRSSHKLQGKWKIIFARRVRRNSFFVIANLNSSAVGLKKITQTKADMMQLRHLFLIFFLIMNAARLTTFQKLLLIKRFGCFLRHIMRPLFLISVNECSLLTFQKPKNNGIHEEAWSLFAS